MEAMVCKMCMANEFREEDGALVCEYCGTRYRIDEVRPKVEAVPVAKPARKPDKRRAFRIWAGVCAAFSAIYLIMGFTEDREMFAPFGFFGILAVMLEVLARSPQDAPCILGKQKGLGRRAFVVVSLVVAFLVTYLLMAVFSPEA